MYIAFGRFFFVIQYAVRTGNTRKGRCCSILRKGTRSVEEDPILPEEKSGAVCHSMRTNDTER